MEFRKLGRTGIDVSSICLGTMTWGQQNTEAEGHEQMDYAVERGINFFDTAELYSIPPKAETQGSTETIIGTWFEAKKNRDKIILATKVVGRTSNTWFRKDGSTGELTKAQILEAVEGSLRRLKTDYIDLYQIHWPDRPIGIFGGLEYKEFGPEINTIAETLEIFDEIVKSGKVRHIGLSNETAWGTMKFVSTAEKTGQPRVASIQNAYNLLNRSFEVGLSEVAQREDVGLLAYSPLAQGYLTGKYQNGQMPEGSRKALFQRLNRYETPNADKATTAYLDIANKHDVDPSQMAIQFVTTRPFVTSNIIGATSMEQLKTNIDSVDLELSEELLKDINDTQLIYSNPCP